TLRAWGKRHKLDAFVHVSLHEGQLTALLDTTAQAEVARLEGCDVRETDVPQTALDAQPIHDRYRDLHEVAQDFRTLKTGRLAVPCQPRGAYAQCRQAFPSPPCSIASMV